MAKEHVALIITAHTPAGPKPLRTWHITDVATALAIFAYLDAPLLTTAGPKKRRGKKRGWPKGKKRGPKIQKPSKAEAQ